MLRKILIIINLILLSGCATKKQIILDDSKALYSYVIGNVNDLKPKISYGETVYITPASCQKSITSLLAYTILGESYKYNTNIYTSDTKGGKDLIIVGAGDPNFTTADLHKLLYSSKNKKFRKIIIDRGIFQVPPMSSNNMISDIGTKYASPISGFNLDKNLINIEIVKNSNNSLKINCDLPYQIKSSITINDSPTNIKTILEENNIVLRGNFNKLDNYILIQTATNNIDHFLILNLQKIAQDLNISGKININNSKNKYDFTNKTLISSYQSPPLIEFLPPGFKISDNIVFDCLYLTIINQFGGIDNWNDGSEIIKKLIYQYFNIDTQKANIVDGSGLSRYNRIQPIILYQILKHGHNLPAYVNSFAKPGEKNSTLVHRQNLSNTIRAKTGNVQGISNLCGYNEISPNPKIFIMHVNSFAPPVVDIFNDIDHYISAQTAK